MPACPICRQVLVRPIDVDKGSCAECRVAIYRVLVDECGMSEEQRDDFFYIFPGCIEFRFMGSLGFGGKVHWTGGRLYVSCYSEDRTPERAAIVERANTKLSALVVRKS